MSPHQFREIAWNGLWKQNTGLAQLLGLCPILAISTSTVNAVSLGLATIVVMAMSNLAVSALRNFIPYEIRIPVFILIIAALVTMVDLAFNAFFHDLYLVLGIFIPLIVTNCIVLARVEAYAAKNAGAMTDLYAREAFSSAFAALPASYAGRKDVRLKVHQAATMAGIAFTQAGLGLCHAMAHSLGGLFHVPHGRLNAILLPSVITCNAHVAAKKYAELARAAGIGGSADTIAVRNLKNGLVRLRRELNLPETLAQAGVDPRSVWRSAEQIVKAALEDPCCKTNPMEVEDFLVRRILEEVTGRV